MCTLLHLPLKKIVKYKIKIKQVLIFIKNHKEIVIIQIYLLRTSQTTMDQQTIEIPLSLTNINLLKIKRYKRSISFNQETL